MSLVSGPGRAPSTGIGLPTELQLVVEKHVQYIQSLDKVSTPTYAVERLPIANTCSGKMNLSTG